MARTQLRMARPHRQSDPLLWGLISAFIIVAIITGILAFIVVRNIVNSWTITDIGNTGPLITSANPNVEAAKVPTPAGTQAVVPLQEPGGGPTPQPWDGASRVNILIMGLDYRDWQAGETPRSDTMILFTLDPVNNTAGMLSIPRDMWVNIPGFNYGKINTAYYLGEIYKLPGGGPGLAAKTVEEFLGVPVQYYAQVDFQAFIKFIDDMGGIDINIPETMTVDPLGPGNTITLRPGVVTLDGATALAFARTRHIEGDDFTRAKNQQLLIMALREQILSLNMLPTLIAKAPVIYEDVKAGIRTNLNLQQVIQLAVSASKVPKENIKRAVIGTKAVSFAKSPDGLDILIPIPDQVRLIRDKVFTNGGPIAPSTTGSEDPAMLAKSEQARVVIENGTQTAGLASRTSEYLRSLGLNVTGETNADQVYPNTILIVVNGKPYTVKYLSQMMKIPTGNIFNRFDPNASADVILILGNDWATNNPMP